MEAEPLSLQIAFKLELVSCQIEDEMLMECCVMKEHGGRSGGSLAGKISASAAKMQGCQQ